MEFLEKSIKIYKSYKNFKNQLKFIEIHEKLLKKSPFSEVFLLNSNNRFQFLTK